MRLRSSLRIDGVIIPLDKIDCGILCGDTIDMIEIDNPGEFDNAYYEWNNCDLNIVTEIKYTVIAAVESWVINHVCKR